MFNFSIKELKKNYLKPIEGKNNIFKNKTIIYIEKETSNFLFIQKLYYRVNKEYVNFKLFDKLLNNFNNEIFYFLKKKNTKNINFKIKFKKIIKNLLKIPNNLFNSNNKFLSNYSTILFMYKYFFFKYLKYFILHFKIIKILKKNKNNITNKEYFSQKFLNKIKILKKLKKLKFFTKNKNQYLLNSINDSSISKLFNLFIVKLIVKKNNVFACCYSMYYDSKLKKYLRKRMFMLSIGRVGIRHTNKKTRPSYERFSRQFFLKLKNYQYKKTKKTMSSYNIIFDLKNFYSDNIFWPFYTCMPKKYYHCKYTIRTYKIPHNTGIRKKKKRRV